ncbi:hypothetical protein COOONC_19224 [Cooperia oncophora]
MSEERGIIHPRPQAALGVSSSLLTMPAAVSQMPVIAQRHRTKSKNSQTLRTIVQDILSALGAVDAFFAMDAFSALQAVCSIDFTRYQRAILSTVFTRTNEPYTLNCLYVVPPSWEIVINVDIVLQQQGSTSSATLELQPGRTASWNNIRLSLIGNIVPQLPILSSTFMETGTDISIVKPVHKGKLEPHSAGQLQCPTRRAAEEFECIFPSNACTCTKGLQKVSCTCSPGDMEALMQASPLPQSSKNFMIYSRNNAILAKTNVGSAIQLHLVAEDLKITSRQSNSSCEVETSDIAGCYNCLAGAELTLSCRSSHEEVTASIICPTQTQIAKCTRNGHLNQIKLHFTTSTISTECIVSCPGGTTTITSEDRSSSSTTV